MNIKQYTDKTTFTGVSEAAIALEAESGSRVMVSAVQPGDEIAASFRYRWHADANARVISPDEVATEVVIPQVKSATKIILTLVVTNASGISAQRSWPILAIPAQNDGGDNHQDGEETAKYPQWSASIPYPKDSKVSHRGGNYMAKWWVIAGTEPGLATTTGPATGNSLPWLQI